MEEAGSSLEQIFLQVTGRDETAASPGAASGAVES
jgi:hypothetical protein